MSVPVFRVGDSVNIVLSNDFYRPAIIISVEALVNQITQETIYNYIVEVTGGVRFKVSENELKF